MARWRAVRTIVAFELRRGWVGIIATSFFALYVGIILSGITDVWDHEKPVSSYLSGMTDWLYAFSFPAFGSLMNCTIFAFWRDDIFTKRIAHWRTMPIPPEAVAAARTLQSIIVMAVAGSLFFLCQYAVSAEIRTQFSPGEWIGAAVVFMSYGLVVNAAYGILELGYAGKTYVKIYLGVSLLLGVVCVIVAYRGVSLLHSMLEAVQRDPILLPIIAVMLAAAALWAGYKLSFRRMRRRSYTF